MAPLKYVQRQMREIHCTKSCKVAIWRLRSLRKINLRKISPNAQGPTKWPTMATIIKFGTMMSHVSFRGKIPQASDYRLAIGIENF